MIGALLVNISFTGQKWAELMDSYMNDLMDRNVRRIVKKFPELDTTEPNPSYV